MATKVYLFTTESYNVYKIELEVPYTEFEANYQTHSFSLGRCIANYSTSSSELNLEQEISGLQITTDDFTTGGVSVTGLVMLPTSAKYFDVNVIIQVTNEEVVPNTSVSRTYFSDVVQIIPTSETPGGNIPTICFFKVTDGIAFRLDNVSITIEDQISSSAEETTAVATDGTTTYNTLEEAIQGVANGGSITLLKDIGAPGAPIIVNHSYIINKSISIYGKGKKIFAYFPIENIDSNISAIIGVTIPTQVSINNNSFFVSKSCNTIHWQTLVEGGELIIEDSTLFTKYYGVFAQSKKQLFNISISNSIIVSENSNAIRLDRAHADVDISNSQIYGSQVLHTRTSGSWGHFYLRGTTVIGGEYNLTLPDETSIASIKKADYGIYSTVRGTQFTLFDSATFDTLSYHIRINKTEPITIDESYLGDRAIGKQLHSIVDSITYWCYWMCFSIEDTIVATSHNNKEKEAEVTLLDDIEEIELNQSIVIPRGIVIEGNKHVLPISNINQEEDRYIKVGNIFNLQGDFFELRNITIGAKPRSDYYIIRQEKQCDIYIDSVSFISSGGGNLYLTIGGNCEIYNSSFISLTAPAIYLTRTASIAIYNSRIMAGAGYAVIDVHNANAIIELKDGTSLETESQELKNLGVTATKPNASIRMRGGDDTYHSPTIKLYDSVKLTPGGNQGYIYYTTNENRMDKYIYFASDYQGDPFISLSSISRGGRIDLHSTLTNALNQNYTYIRIGKPSVSIDLTDNYEIARNYIIEPAIIFNYLTGQNLVDIDGNIVEQARVEFIVSPTSKMISLENDSITLTLNKILIDANNFINGFANISYRAKNYTFYKNLQTALTKGFRVYATSDDAIKSANDAGHATINTEVYGGVTYAEIVRAVEQKDYFPENEELNNLWNRLVNVVNYISQSKTADWLKNIYTALSSCEECINIAKPNGNPETAGDYMKNIATYARFLFGDQNYASENEDDWNTFQEIVELLEAKL